MQSRNRLCTQEIASYSREIERHTGEIDAYSCCTSAGDSEEEAIHNAREALELWFEPSPLALSEGSKVLEVALA